MKSTVRKSYDLLGLSLVMATGIVACQGDNAAPSPAAQAPAKSAEAAPAPVVAAPPAAAEALGTCTYSYDPDGTKLIWTAFKLTERIGVAGTFNRISVTGAQPAPEPHRVLSTLAFEVDTSTVNTQNPDRDKKLVTSLFGVLPEGGKISGKVTAIADGKGTVELVMGGVTKDIALTYQVDDKGLLVAQGKVDLGDFGGAPAVAALNKVCEAQHTGPDKTSKLWPDVELKIESQLKKDCAPSAAKAAPAE